MRKKLKECGGFTMVEMLCVVLILVMLCLLTSSGLSMAMRSYRDIIAESETQLLLNDISDAMADKLRYAIVTVKQKEEAGTLTTYYTFSLENVALRDGGEVKNIVSPADPTDPVNYVDMVNDGKVILGTGTLLPSGAYGSKLSSVPGDERRYEVEVAGVSWDNDQDPDNTAPNLNDLREDQTITFYITLKVKDRWGSVSKEKKLTVRCMNPVKKEVS